MHQSDYVGHDNPPFGTVLGADQKRGVFIYKSNFTSGAIFYRRQKRADYDLPFAFCHDRELKGIGIGRDRADLTKQEARRVVQECVSCLSADAMESLVTHELRDFWQRGHPFLTALSKRWRDLYDWDDKRRRIAFPEECVAESHEWRVDDEARSSGLTVCSGTMEAFGMETTRARMRALAKGKLRKPIGKETELFDILGEAGALIFYAPIEGRMYMVFVPEDEKDSFEGAYGDRTLALKESVLRGSLGNALSVFLHEVAHPYGWDGSRVLTDKLTDALAQVYEHRHELELLEGRWNEILERPAELDEPRDRQDGAVSTDRTNLAALERRVRLLEAAVEKLQRNPNPSG